MVWFSRKDTMDVLEERLLRKQALLAEASNQLGKAKDALGRMQRLQLEVSALLVELAQKNTKKKAAGVEHKESLKKLRKALGWR